jgi:hypothetical protein
MARRPRCGFEPASLETATPLKARGTRAGQCVVSTCCSPSDKRPGVEMRRPTGGSRGDYFSDLNKHRIQFSMQEK